VNQENKIALGPVTVVTLTYGDRKLLLRQVLEALRDLNNVERVLVVDNGATWDVKSDLVAIYQDWVEVVDMGKNTGSAKGFVAGMRRAIEVGAELIL
jgi:GT2 family glycosyltransferase